MEKLTVGAGEWVVVCDGRKALILENQGDGKFPDLRVRETHEHEDSKTGEQGTDRPGRVHESASPARSAVEQTDWHDLAEQSFLSMLAGLLEEALNAGKTKAVTIVAAPRALGMIRPLYGPALRKAVRAEIAKDLVNMPAHEIERQLLHKG